jgi:Tol biopolymer transport system component/DNA-binding winged helix-turn-helix (wHTH) protein
MATQPKSPARHAFGPFEVDASAGELRKRGVRLRLSGQPLQILLTLLAQPREVVTREQLREEVWGETTFVDFEHGLNAAMNKLRRALGDSAENPRYIETVPGRGYRFIGAVEADHVPPVFPLNVSVIHEERRKRRSARIWWWLASTALLVALSFALGWLFHRSPGSFPSWKLTQLTTDAGLSNAPTLSEDGKLVAYSSDRGLDGERDLYIKQVAGGEPIRLTFDGHGNTAPDFSPDGARIVFHSNRDGGGIYEIPAFGGEARLLARDGLNPRFSPDGLQVAYWIGDENVANTVPGSGTVWVVPVAGGQPRQVGPNFTAARYPIWSPDGKHLLLVGYTSQKAYESSAIDWWVVPINGGQPVRTGAYDALFRAGFEVRDFIIHAPTRYATVPRPSCWLAVPSRVIFSTESGDAQSLWETGISVDTGKISGVFRRLTVGAGNEVEPSSATGDSLAFTHLEIRSDIWSFPFDLNRGKSNGVLERVTENPGVREHSSLSSNGRHVAFASAQSGRFNIWLRDLATERESHVASSSFVQRFPVINASGSRIAFSAYEGNGKRSVYVFTQGGTLEKMCEGCLRATDWSHDEKTLLIFGGGPYQINALNLASHQQAALLKHATWNLLYGRFSPDNLWVSFTARIQPNRARMMIAPIDGPKPVPERAWIKIAEGAGEDWANWSPDGKTLYFTSARDGHFCLWGQRIEASSHRPVGEPFAVQHFHGRVSYQQGGWSAAGGRIAMVLSENTGNIWLMSRSGAR